jgi:hypothetical protein
MTPAQCVLPFEQRAIEQGETERVLRERQWQRNFRRALQTEGER